MYAMLCKPASARVLLVTGILLITGSISAAAKKKTVEKPDPGLAAVEKVLRAEVAGQVDRREQLAGTVHERPNSLSARWQAGFVRDRGLWRSFDEAPRTT